MKTQDMNHCLEDARQRVTREVRESPLLWLGLAVGLGALVGLAAGRGSVSHSGWLAETASDLSDRAHKAGDRALRTSRLAGKELQSAARHASDALPEVDLDRLVSRGRHWLRSALS